MNYLLDKFLLKFDGIILVFLNFKVKSPTRGRAILLSKLVDGGCEFNFRSRLSTQLFGVFRGFLRNSRRCELGSLRKTATDDIPPIVPRPSCDNWTYFYNPIQLKSKNNLRKKNGLPSNFKTKIWSQRQQNNNNKLYKRKNTCDYLVS